MAAVLDTHAVVWFLLDSENLSAAALAAIEGAGRSGDPVYVPAISIVEVVYLVERGRLPEMALRRLGDALKAENAALVVAPLDAGIALAVQGISRELVPDMPDRIIAATALHLRLPLVTRDKRIQSAGVATIW